MYVPAVATVNDVAVFVPTVGSMFGVAAAQSVAAVAQITESPAATVPVSSIDVATPAVMLVGTMAEITEALVAEALVAWRR